MIKWLSIGSLLGFVLLNSCFGEEKKSKSSAMRWTVSGLTVGKRAPETDPLQFREGTEVLASVELTDGFLLTTDLKNSKLDSFTDDKGRDLLEKAPQYKTATIARKSSAVSDGKQLTLEFRAGHVPAPGATKIRIKGAVIVLVGRSEKEIEMQNVIFARGVDLPIGTLKVGSFKTLTCSGPLPAKEATFISPDAKKIELHVHTTYGTEKNSDKPVFHTTLQPHPFEKTKVDRGTIRLTYFAKVERITVPVDIEVGLGF